MDALYRANDDFREYVDRYCACRGILKEIAFTHKIVQIYAEYLANV